MEFRIGALSGLLYAAATPPSPLGFLGYFALTPLLILLFDPEQLRHSVRPRIGMLALGHGLVRYMIQLHWLMLLGEASPLSFRWALPFMLVLLALYMTLADFILLWLLMKIRDWVGAQAIWFFPGLWILLEWSRALGDMGFPWLRLATTQLSYVPMLQLAGLFGELGVSLFVAWINVFFALSWQGFRGAFPTLGRATLSRWWAPAALVLFLFGNYGYGLWTISQLEAEVGGDEPELSVGVVQANVSLMDKWNPAKRDSTFVPYTQLTRRVASQGARLVVWPETAIPLDIARSAAYLELIRELVRDNEIYLLAGFPEHVVTDTGLLDGHNSSFLMDDAGVIRDRYRKMHLLAFGERMPFQDLIPLISKLDFGQAEWTPGPTQTVFDIDGHRFGVMICFESIFPNLAREAVRNGAGFLVNITNDGWFGDTVLPHQHAWMAVMRAAEHRVPLVRCANNGVSFWVDATGRVHDTTEVFERRSFTATLRPRPGGSPYTRYGDAGLFLLVGLGFVYLVVVRRNQLRVR